MLKIKLNEGNEKLRGRYLSIFNLGEGLELYLDGEEVKEDKDIYYLSVHLDTGDMFKKYFSHSLN